MADKNRRISSFAAQVAADIHIHTAGERAGRNRIMMGFSFLAPSRGSNVEGCLSSYLRKRVVIFLV